MLNHAAEESFQNGKRALGLGRVLEALARFEAAIELERRHGTRRIQARYLSYYGLCLAVESKQVRQGVYFCREAVSQESYDPDLYFNLGRALLEAGRRREAHHAVAAGLRLQPGHRDLRRLMSHMGQRRTPLLPFLSRSNPLNVMLGRMTGER